MPSHDTPVLRVPAPPEARAAVEELVARYASQADHYAGASYNETQARCDFIDPLFEALGWDVANKRAYAEPYREVIHEDAIKVAGGTKAPDYCFRVGGRRMFFVEAKKPSVSIAGDPGPAYQLRRYGWSAGLPLSILTDFEEFAVYDCSRRPKPSDAPSVARVTYCRYGDYLDHLDDLYSTFSQEAILRGAFDRYAEDASRKRGTATVDDAFLTEIERWREELAKDLARGNPDLSVHDLNAAVQMTVDRILFLRMAEDRGVEPYARLRDLAGKRTVYPQLVDLYHAAEEKYNSGLFAFDKKGDTLSPRLLISDKTLKPILKGLYYPECPYEFSVIGADILGAVYERFLGKTIRLTAGHHAKVEEKPEVRKAGGVYYTPRYIVDYIVEHTVGELLREWEAPSEGPNEHAPTGGAERANCAKSGPRGRRPCAPAPAPSRAAAALPALRILDPACGSGSFLLGAYQYLLDWHLRHYTGGEPPPAQEGAMNRAPTPTAPAPVDAGDAADVAPAGPAHAAPVGASFMTPAPADAEPIPLSRARERAGVRAPHERPESFARGRNPKLVRSPSGDWRLSLSERKRVLTECIYGVDIDRQAVEVTKLNLLLKCLEGETEQTVSAQMQLFHDRVLPNIDANIKCGNSLIGPDYWDGRQTAMFDEDESRRVNPFDWHREFPTIMHNGGFDAVIGNPPYLSYSGRQAVELSPVVRDHLASRYDCAGWMTSHGLFIQRAVSSLSCRVIAFIVPDQVGHLAGYGGVRALVTSRMGLRDVRYWGERVFSGVTTPALTLVADREYEGATTVTDEHGRSRSVALAGAIPWGASDTLDLLAKIQEGSVSLGDLVADPGVHTGNCSKALIVPTDGAQGGVAPVLEGKQVARYSCSPPKKGLRLDYQPAVGEYFTIRPERKYADAAFVVRQTAAYPIVGPREHALYFRNSLLALYSPDDGTDVRYLVGLLNSRLIRFAYCSVVRESQQKAFPQVKVASLRALPIRFADTSTPGGLTVHGRLVSLVQTMLDLHKGLRDTRTSADRELIERQIDATDRQIDTLVYDLYALTPAEIAIVEGVAAGGNGPSPHERA